jgi:hypothetical protein
MDGDACPDLGVDLPLPLAPKPWRLLLVLRMCRRVDRMDALGEAWAAALAGEDPATAVDRWRKRETRYRVRHPMGIEIDATSRPLPMRCRRSPRPKGSDAPQRDA